MALTLRGGFPLLDAPITDPATGRITKIWSDYLRLQFTRLGGGVGPTVPVNVIDDNSTYGAIGYDLADSVSVDLTGVNVSIADLQAQAALGLEPDASVDLTALTGTIAELQSMSAVGIEPDALGATIAELQAMDAVADVAEPFDPTALLALIADLQALVTVLTEPDAAAVVPTSTGAIPLIDGTAATGTAGTYAREAHVHPTDTTRAALTGAAFTGAVSVTDASTSSTTSLVLSATADTNGANFRMLGDGATTPAKTIRVHSGNLQILNNAYSAVIASVNDAGGLGVFGVTPPAARPAITGSRGTATATVLASLLTALAATGIITDSTTA